MKVQYTLEQPISLCTIKKRGRIYRPTKHSAQGREGLIEPLLFY